MCCEPPKSQELLKRSKIFKKSDERQKAEKGQTKIFEMEQNVKKNVKSTPK